MPVPTSARARQLSAAEVDRAAGALVGTAAGDALGAGYEFGPALGDEVAVQMRGGGPFAWAPGEFTDDTQMACCIAEVAATGADLTSPAALEAVAQRFVAWYRGGPPDVGTTTRVPLAAAARRHAVPLAGVCASAADHHFATTGAGAGNGSLMRTAPVAVAYLGHPAGSAQRRAMAAAARAVSGLTHGDPLAGDACVLWCAALDAAMRTASLDAALAALHEAVVRLPDARGAVWSALVDAALASPPGRFSPNGYVATALQAALSAVVSTAAAATAAQPAATLPLALAAAVRIGDDTDTVAAIAGGLLGATFGASAVPWSWRRIIHGSVGGHHYTTRDLVRLGALSARLGAADDSGWPVAADLWPYYRHRWPQRPFALALEGDPGLVVGNVSALTTPGLVDTDAVVSLCRIGGAQRPAGLAPADHVEAWLVDSEDPAANPSLDLVLDDAAAAVATLRSENKRVFLHCVLGASRTPTVAALYLARRLGLPGRAALDAVVAQLRPHVSGPLAPNLAFAAALDRLAP